MNPTLKGHQRSARRQKFAIHGTAHLFLILGCIIFGFPFYWLLSTSVKEQDEMFADPAIWVPRWPAAIVRSPYYAQDQYRMPKPPKGIENDAWREMLPKLTTAAAEVMRTKYLQPNKLGADITPDDEKPIGWGLLTSLSPRLTDEQVKALQSGDPATTLAKAATERDYKAVWDNVHRRLLIRDVTFQDQGFVQYRLESGNDLTKTWNVISGDATLEEATLGSEKAAAIAYTFEREKNFSLEANFTAPAGAGAFRRLTVPVRPDKSWHRVDAEIETGGKKYVSTEPLVLFTALSQEVTWQVPDPDRSGASAFRDYLAIKEVGASSAPKNQVKVKLTFNHNNSLAAGYAKARRNYKDAMNFIPLGSYYGNTLILVLLNVVGQMFSCSLVAYAFARLRWPGRDGLFALLLATMMLPGQVTMIPVFLIFRNLGLYNTLEPLWIPSLFGSAFFIFMLRQFMRNIPKELEEAAKIDGCGYFGIYWRVILPLMKPALAAVAIFTFMNTWNEFMGPLIYLNDQRLYPLSLGLYQFRIEHAADYGMLMAASALMTIPVVIVFFIAQKQFIQGVQLSGIKG